eukprot:SAG31_NODE_23836_length_494_cov_1.432911_1_plen_104_part_01
MAVLSTERTRAARLRLLCAFQLGVVLLLGRYFLARRRTAPAGAHLELGALPHRAGRDADSAAAEQWTQLVERIDADAAAELAQHPDTDPGHEEDSTADGVPNVA